MADFSLPVLTSTYADFLTYLKDRDVDAISLGYGTITNPATGFMRYVRASNKFQEWDGAAWQDKNLSVAGGGTGAATAANARTNLGVGSIATQDSNNVTITGGTISGLSSFSVSGTITGQNLTGTGVLTMGSGAVQLTTAGGKIQAINSTYFNSLDGSALTALAAANITAGGTLPALNGSALTALNASNLASGTVAHARLGSGGGGSTKFLREDNTWQEAGGVQSINLYTGTISVASGFSGSKDVTITAVVTAKSVVIPARADGKLFTDYGGGTGVNLDTCYASIPGTTTVRFNDVVGNGVDTRTPHYAFWVVEYK